MAKVKEFLSIPLDGLEIGQGQARTRDVSVGIAELADSIKRVGLLEPIVVCEGSISGKFQILTGQRRFLAHKELVVQPLGAPSEEVGGPGLPGQGPDREMRGSIERSRTLSTL